MGTLMESTFVTLDGVVERPERWSPPYWDEEHAGYASNLLKAADALLLGRATYDAFAGSWPQRSLGIEHRPDVARQSAATTIGTGPSPNVVYAIATPSTVRA